MRKTLIALPVLLGALFLASCTFARSHVNNPDFPTVAYQVKEGTTNSDQLLSLLGAPNAILPAGDGAEVYLYTFGDGKTGGLNLILVNFQKTNLGVDSGYFVVDKNKVVTRKLISTHSQGVEWDWWPFSD